MKTRYFHIIFVEAPPLLKILFFLVLMSYGWSAEGKGDLGRARETYSEITPVLVIMCETLYITMWLSENLVVLVLKIKIILIYWNNTSKSYTLSVQSCIKISSLLVSAHEISTG